MSGSTAGVDTASPGPDPVQLDVLVVGAGFAGLYALHKARSDGRSVLVLERADAVGGTWLYNCYPGARCDIESIEYSYSFSDEIQQEWDWTETLPGQPEIEAYLNFVADRLDLRRDIRFGTEVVALTFDESAARWLARTASGDLFSASFVVAATGILSAPLAPDIPGVGTFAGTSLHTSDFPREGFDFTGKRIALIGTGSTGVQATPVIAEQAAQLYVFQRSAAYTLPSNARPFRDGELQDLKAHYAQIRDVQRKAHVGAGRLSAFSVMTEVATRPPIMSVSREEQLRAVEERGVAGALYWSDIFTDPDAGKRATELYGEALARIVHDPETAASLVPTYPFGCKRPIIDQGYYSAFNRDNVTLVDLRKDPLREITASGLRTESSTYDVDVIVYATGFDALTGALSRLDVRGRDGVLLRDVWAAEGPVSYLGLQVAGFPNLFMIGGPQSPSPASNFVALLELQIDWLADCITHLHDARSRTIEALPSAQDTWVEHNSAMVQGTVIAHPSCSSWWNGGNVPGKRRMFMAYTAGMPAYRRCCDDVAAGGYTGFSIG